MEELNISKANNINELIKFLGEVEEKLKTLIIEQALILCSEIKALKGGYKIRKDFSYTKLVDKDTIEVGAQH